MEDETHFNVKLLYIYGSKKQKNLYIYSLHRNQMECGECENNKNDANGARRKKKKK